MNEILLLLSKDYNTITCDQLTNGPPYSFDSTYLAGLNPTVFRSCVTILGALSNTYSSDQIAALASVAIVSQK
jgi:hypothetical protein